MATAQEYAGKNPCVGGHVTGTSLDVTSNKVSFEV